jgi:hypothetical protein
MPHNNATNVAEVSKTFAAAVIVFAVVVLVLASTLVYGQ